MLTPPPELETDETKCSPRRSRRLCRVKLSNAVQRILSASILGPLITYFLWQSPAFATTTVCAVVVSLACHEYSWLAYRIHTRWITALSRYEESHLTVNTTRLSMDHSQSSPNEEENGIEPLSDALSSSQEYVIDTMQETNVAYNGQRCAISNLSDRYVCGNEWVTAFLISVLGTILSTTLFVHIMSWRSFDKVHFHGFHLYYSIISSFAAWMCACFCPNWKYAFILLLEKEVFMILTMYSMQCPINHFQCTDAISPTVFLRSSAIIIVTFRLLTTHRRTIFDAAVYLHILLDFVGFVYIIGSLFYIVTFVDGERVKTYRKLIIMLLYVVWSSDTGAYVAGKLMEMGKYTHSHPLAPHLSHYKDYEGTVIAIGFGVVTMFILSQILDIHGSNIEKFIFASMAVILGRVGDLFESMIKRAAMVKDSGTIIPGHGGILDRIDALMFASIVFSRYFGAIVSAVDMLNQ